MTIINVNPAPVINVTPPPEITIVNVSPPPDIEIIVGVASYLPAKKQIHSQSFSFEDESVFLYQLSESETLITLWIQIIEAFNSETTITVGDNDNPDVVMPSSFIDPTLEDSFLINPLFKNAENIDISLFINDGTVGSGIVYFMVN
jgi:hypothetical protein